MGVSPWSVQLNPGVAAPIVPQGPVVDTGGRGMAMGWVARLLPRGRVTGATNTGDAGTASAKMELGIYGAGAHDGGAAWPCPARPAPLVRPELPVPVRWVGGAEIGVGGWARAVTGGVAGEEAGAVKAEGLPGPLDTPRLVVDTVGARMMGVPASAGEVAEVRVGAVEVALPLGTGVPAADEGEEGVGEVGGGGAMGRLGIAEVGVDVEGALLPVVRED